MTPAPAPYYESDRGLAEYLDFQYGPEPEPPFPGLPWPAVGNFPARCVAAGLPGGPLPVGARALDLGCAVGRSAFELARYCSEVVGLDYSARFIAAARQLQTAGELAYHRTDEGLLTRPATARVPADIDRTRVRFATGDATALPADLGRFDVALLANLIDRLPDPRACLARLPGLLRPGARLILTSPYTWLAEYTPPDHWLGGRPGPTGPERTHDALREALAPHFELVATYNLPFLLREHTRKYQFTIAEATIWVRRD